VGRASNNEAPDFRDYFPSKKKKLTLIQGGGDLNPLEYKRVQVLRFGENLKNLMPLDVKFEVSFHFSSLNKALVSCTILFLQSKAWVYSTR